MYHKPDDHNVNDDIMLENIIMEPIIYSATYFQSRCVQLKMEMYTWCGKLCPFTTL